MWSFRLPCSIRRIFLSSWQMTLINLTKWSPLVDIGVKSSVIPIWVSFSQLRPHRFWFSDGR
ncbi:hypothetical protein IEQ34_010358 [Dendrobium chrysotoxum]|uniref:DUF4283 domain-containing protein n=1 Tax=Dendrobium chrysotoxum TaxID=161865 RepID=A0AAV7H553_DENCH|nr:hypothetical protein IEQ34_010358 [Dendrobium chrysotoxum]